MYKVCEWDSTLNAQVERDATPEEAAYADYLKSQAQANKAAFAREKRDALLKETDWTQAADVPQATKDKWAPYRQALRDVPQQAGFPDNIQWPVKPE